MQQAGKRASEGSRAGRRTAGRRGAAPARVRIREVDDQALAYLLGVAMRVRVRAVGPVRERSTTLTPPPAVPTVVP